MTVSHVIVILSVLPCQLSSKSSSHVSLPLLRLYIRQCISQCIQYNFNFVQQCIQISTRINSSNVHLCLFHSKHIQYSTEPWAAESLQWFFYLVRRERKLHYEWWVILLRKWFFSTLMPSIMNDESYSWENDFFLLWCLPLWMMSHTLEKMLQFFYSDAFLTELTWQVLIEGYLTLLLFVRQLTFGLRCVSVIQ